MPISGCSSQKETDGWKRYIRLSRRHHRKVRYVCRRRLCKFCSILFQRQEWCRYFLCKVPWRCWAYKSQCLIGLSSLRDDFWCRSAAPHTRNRSCFCCVVFIWVQVSMLTASTIALVICCAVLVLSLILIALIEVHRRSLEKTSGDWLLSDSTHLVVVAKFVTRFCGSSMVAAFLFLTILQDAASRNNVRYKVVTKHFQVNAWTR